MEAVAELIQQKEVLIDPFDSSMGKMTFYGGVTLIIDLSPDKEGEMRYVIRKNLDLDDQENERLQIQRSFFKDSATRYSLNVYSNDIDINLPTKSAKGKKGLSFDMVHRGY